MIPQVDQAIIAKMQHGWKAVTCTVILLASFAVAVVSGLSGNKTFMAYAAPTFVVLFIVIYNLTTRKPRCSICGGKLHVVNRVVSLEEHRRLFSAPGSPRLLRTAAPWLNRSDKHRSIQGFECYHCRKIALLG